jgi:hypothetical protein
MTDDLVSFAGRYQRDAAAALIQVIRDETAPAASRVAAAKEVLAFSKSIRPITVHDIAAMDEQTRHQLWAALFTHYQNEIPERFSALLREAVNDALAQQASIKSTRPVTFIRGPVLTPSTSPPPGYPLTPQQPNKRLAKAVHAEGASARIPNSGAAALPHEHPLKAISENAAKSPDPAIRGTSTMEGARPRIGDIPIDQEISDYIKPRADHPVKGNGHAGPDYATAFRDYQAAAMRWRKQ